MCAFTGGGDDARVLARVERHVCDLLSDRRVAATVLHRRVVMVASVLYRLEGYFYGNVCHRANCCASPVCVRVYVVFASFQRDQCFVKNCPRR